MWTRNTCRQVEAFGPTLLCYFFFLHVTQVSRKSTGVRALWTDNNAKRFHLQTRPAHTHSSAKITRWHSFLSLSMKSHVFLFFSFFISRDFLTHNRKDMTPNTHAGDNATRAYGIWKRCGTRIRGVFRQSKAKMSHRCINWSVSSRFTLSWFDLASDRLSFFVHRDIPLSS